MTIMKDFLSQPIVAEDGDKLFRADVLTTRSAEQRQGICSICDRPIGMGWLCLDGGQQVCSSHISVSRTGDLSVDKYAAVGNI